MNSDIGKRKKLFLLGQQQEKPVQRIKDQRSISPHAVEEVIISAELVKELPRKVEFEQSIDTTICGMSPVESSSNENASKNETLPVVASTISRHNEVIILKEVSGDFLQEIDAADTQSQGQDILFSEELSPVESSQNKNEGAEESDIQSTAKAEHCQVVAYESKTEALRRKIEEICKMKQIEYDNDREYIEEEEEEEEEIVAVAEQEDPITEKHPNFDNAFAKQLPKSESEIQEDEEEAHENEEFTESETEKINLIIDEADYSKISESICPSEEVIKSKRESPSSQSKESSLLEYSPDLRESSELGSLVRSTHDLISSRMKERLLSAQRSIFEWQDDLTDSSLLLGAVVAMQQSQQNFSSQEEPTDLVTKPIPPINCTDIETVERKRQKEDEQLIKDDSKNENSEPESASKISLSAIIESLKMASPTKPSAEASPSKKHGGLYGSRTPSTSKQALRALDMNRKLNVNQFVDTPQISPQNQHSIVSDIRIVAVDLSEIEREKNRRCILEYLVQLTRDRPMNRFREKLNSIQDMKPYKDHLLKMSLVKQGVVDRLQSIVVANRSLLVNGRIPIAIVDFFIEIKSLKYRMQLIKRDLKMFAETLESVNYSQSIRNDERLSRKFILKHELSRVEDVLSLYELAEAYLHCSKKDLLSLGNEIYESLTLGRKQYQVSIPKTPTLKERAMAILRRRFQ